MYNIGLQVGMGTIRFRSENLVLISISFRNQSSLSLFFCCRDGVASDESPSGGSLSEEQGHPVSFVSNDPVAVTNGVILVSSSDDGEAYSESCDELQEILSSDEEDAFEIAEEPQDHTFQRTNDEDVIKFSENSRMNGNSRQSTSSTPSASEDGSSSCEESEDNQDILLSKEMPLTADSSEPGISAEKIEPSGDSSDQNIVHAPIDSEKVLRKRKSSLADSAQEERRICARNGTTEEARSMPGTTSDNPSPDRNTSAIKSILKGTKTRERTRSGNKPKKSVRFKKGSALSEVVGVASGVGFDSVAMPNMRALQKIWRERGGGRGKGQGLRRNGGRGGRGRRSGPKQVRGRSRGRKR